MSDYATKIVTLKNLLGQETISERFGASLCFGHFNVIHPGHLRYFHTARRYGDRLIVAIEGDKTLSTQSELGEWFSESERASAVAALEVVDEVVVLDSGQLVDLVSLIKPSSLVLGREFERERANEVLDPVNRVHQYGGQVVFEAGETRYTRVDFVHGNQDELERERWFQFRSALTSQGIILSQLLTRMRDKAKPKLLILGDTIVDQYIACDPIGMSNEAPIVVVKELETREFIGGAAIVAAHVAALGAGCSYLSVAGDDREADVVRKNLAELDVASSLLMDPSRPTTNKIRYMVENQKLFRVSRLKEHGLSRSLEDKIIGKLMDLMPGLDGILVCDFVYGVITPRVLEVVTKISQDHNLPLFGDLQCSSQIGNVSKFRDFQLLCPTEREARIALSNQDDGVEYVANLLMEKTRSANLVIKLGSEGLIAYERDKTGNFVHRQHFPAITANPVDVSGAGDSLLAAMSVVMTMGFSLMEAAALGSCMAALAIRTVGNQPINFEQLEQFIERGRI